MKATCVSHIKTPSIHVYYTWFTLMTTSRPELISAAVTSPLYSFKKISYIILEIWSNSVGMPNVWSCEIREFCTFTMFSSRADPGFEISGAQVWQRPNCLISKLIYYTLNEVLKLNLIWTVAFPMFLLFQSMLWQFQGKRISIMS